MRVRLGRSLPLKQAFSGALLPFSLTGNTPIFIIKHRTEVFHPPSGVIAN